MTRENTKYNNVFRRIGASIIDFLVFIPLSILDTYICESTGSEFVISTWGCIMSFITIFYSVFLHYKYGQTFGKMATNLKVIDLNESKEITLKQSVLRSTPYIFIELFRLISLSVLILTSSDTIFDKSDRADYLSLIVALLVVLLEIIVLFSNKKKDGATRLYCKDSCSEAAL